MYAYGTSINETSHENKKETVNLYNRFFHKITYNCFNVISLRKKGLIKIKGRIKFLPLLQSLFIRGFQPLSST